VASLSGVQLTISVTDTLAGTSSRTIACFSACSEGMPSTEAGVDYRRLLILEDCALACVVSRLRRRLSVSDFFGAPSSYRGASTIKEG